MDLLRTFELGQPLAAPGQDVCFRCGIAQRDGGFDLLTQCRMRNAEADGCAHLGMGEQDFVDLGRSDLFASAVDQLLNSSHEAQVAIGIEHTLVAGAKPAVEKRSRIRFGVVLITLNDVRTLDYNLALLASVEMPPFVIHDADANSRSRSN